MDQIVTLEETKKENKKRDSYMRIIRIYIIPIISVLIFMNILIFFVIDKVGDLLNDVDEINSLENDLDTQSTLLDNIELLEEEEDTLLTNLSAINSIAPSGETEVVSFSEKVFNIAQSHNLSGVHQITSDNRDVASETVSTASSAVKLLEVPVTFNLVGNFSDIDEFITELSQIDDFVIISGFKLAGNLDDGWTFQLTFSKYQFEEDSVNSNSEYMLVSPTKRLDEEIEEYLNTRAL